MQQRMAGISEERTTQNEQEQTGAGFLGVYFYSEPFIMVCCHSLDNTELQVW